MASRGAWPAVSSRLEIVSLRGIFAAIILAIILATAFASAARAQGFADNTKWELGGHYAFLSLPSQCSGSAGCASANSGVGANLTYNFSPWMGLDSEVNFFGNNGDAATLATGGNVTEALFGLRFGPTTRRWGLYSVVRPGFLNFSRVLANNLPAAAAGTAFPATSTTPQFSAVMNYQAAAASPMAAAGFTRATDFAFNYGEAVEYRPVKHAALRFDIGDTIVHYPGATLGTPLHRHNFQISQAIVFRF